MSSHRMRRILRERIKTAALALSQLWLTMPRRRYAASRGRASCPCSCTCLFSFFRCANPYTHRAITATPNAVNGISTITSVSLSSFDQYANRNQSQSGCGKDHQPDLGWQIDPSLVKGGVQRNEYEKQNSDFSYGLPNQFSPVAQSLPFSIINATHAALKMPLVTLLAIAEFCIA
jgi:hypothetical protein